ncbi:MAG TPA: MerR family transcriptional regulator [Candidatus Micrarchaeia archaeon]|nr:MerR family transcriptional regulator [Candidatus Micrarchaeia archaeon]
MNGPAPGPDPTRLNIGQVAALTGITPGRIRHYEARGLVRLDHAASGYRHFSAADVLRLLHIDLLRSLGMGLDEIRRSLSGGSQDLRAALLRHRETLGGERDRIDRLLRAVDTALAEPEAPAERIVARVASAHRESLGIFGRLAQPLSDQASAAFGRLLGEDWGLPVPALFGQMVLPAAITDLLERLALVPEHPLLFQRMRGLAARILALVAEDAPPAAADRLGSEWVQSQIDAPLPEPVATLFRSACARAQAVDVLNRGFELWAESISPLAAQVLRTTRREAGRRGLVVLGMVVVSRRPAAAHSASS